MLTTTKFVTKHFLFEKFVYFSKIFRALLFIQKLQEISIALSGTSKLIMYTATILKLKKK